MDELADDSRPTLLEQIVDASSAPDGGHSLRLLVADMTSSKTGISASDMHGDGGDEASGVTEPVRSMGHASDGLTLEEMRARAHGHGLSDGGYSGDDDDDAYDDTESEEDGVVGTLARPGEVKEGFVRRRRAGMISRGAMTEAVYRDVIEQVSVEGVLPADAPEQDGADMPLLLTPDAERALQSRVSTGPGSSPGVNVEDALVTAVEDPLSRTIRGGAQPATLRALLAGQQLEQKGAFDAVASSSTAGSLGDAVIPGTEEALRLQTLKVGGCWRCRALVWWREHVMTPALAAWCCTATATCTEVCRGCPLVAFSHGSRRQPCMCARCIGSSNDRRLLSRACEPRELLRRPE